MIREPYEVVLDGLLAEGRISDSEREGFRQQVKASEERIYDEFPTLVFGCLAEM